MKKIVFLIVFLVSGTEMVKARQCGSLLISSDNANESFTISQRDIAALIATPLGEQIQERIKAWLISREVRLPTLLSFEDLLETYHEQDPRGARRLFKLMAHWHRIERPAQASQVPSEVSGRGEEASLLEHPQRALAILRLSQAEDWLRPGSFLQRLFGGELKPLWRVQPPNLNCCTFDDISSALEVAANKLERMAEAGGEGWQEALTEWLDLVRAAQIEKALFDTHILASEMVGRFPVAEFRAISIPSGSGSDLAAFRRLKMKILSGLVVALGGLAP